MPDNHTNTTVRETHVRETGGSRPLAFILGGVVVALAIIGFVLYSDAIDPSGGGGGDTNINVEAPAADPAPAEPAEPAAPADTGN